MRNLLDHRNFERGSIADARIGDHETPCAQRAMLPLFPG
jgi:hypothetical protein